jgi:DNA-binding MarR family transcriptional regulator
MIPNPGDPGCTCYRLRQAGRLVSRLYDQSLAPLGINIGQFGLLATLNAMSGASVMRVANVLQMDRTTLTRNLSPLERLGYISAGSRSGMRVRALSLTKRGKDLLKTAKPLWKNAQDGLVKNLGRARAKMLHEILEESIDRIQLAEKRSLMKRSR